MFTLSILHLAFIAGLLMFSIVVIFVPVGAPTPAPSPGSPPAPSNTSDMEGLFAVMIGAWGLLTLPATLFILPAMRKKAGLSAADAAGDPDPDAPKLAAIGHYTTGLLLRAALAEGWGLFGAVAAFITGNLLFLIAPVVAAMIIGAYFPTRSKFEKFYSQSIDKASKESFQ
jgi:hypothetical protein